MHQPIMTSSEIAEFDAALSRERLSNAEFPAHKHCEFIAIIVDLFPMSERKNWDSLFPVMVR